MEREPIWWSLKIKHYHVDDLTAEQRLALYNELVTVEDSLASILNRYGIDY